jgi:nucleoside-diphosphate-sugar epimerase
MSKKIIIHIFDLAGSFAENKDIAKKIRKEMIFPAIAEGSEIEFDFSQVEDATQSFVHAMLSEAIRETEGEILDIVYFSNCNETIKQIINMVVDYMVEAQD